MKNIVGNVLRILALTVVFVVGIVVPTLIIPVPPEITVRVTKDMQNTIFVLMLLVSLLGAIALSINVKLSEWSGTKLILALGLSFWGIEYFIAQIETLYFREAFPFMTNMEILNIMLRGVITTIIVVPLTVIIFGKRKATENIIIKEALAKIKIKSWVKKAPVFALLYIVIYLFFGYYVAWQFEAVRLFYSGTTEQLNFINHIIMTMKGRPLFLLYHFIRGLLWIGFSVPIILMNSSRIKTMISLMLLFSYHGFQIIMAQGIFPPDVLIGHTIETTISACIYGGLIGYMFYVPDSSIISAIRN